MKLTYSESILSFYRDLQVLEGILTWDVLVFILQAGAGVENWLCLREGCDWVLDENDGVQHASSRTASNAEEKSNTFPLRPQSVWQREELDALLITTNYLVWRITDF